MACSVGGGCGAWMRVSVAVMKGLGHIDCYSLGQVG